MSRCTILQLVSICLSYYLYYSCSSIPRYYSFTDAFVTPSRSSTTTFHNTAIASSRNSRNDASSSSSFRSKRQERIGQEVQKELSDIFHSCPHEIKFTSSLQQQVSSMIREDELLKRLSIVRVDVSPDLRQAKIIISLVQQQSSSSNNNNNMMMDRRRVYSFVVTYTKQIRHALSQRLKHWKILPQLTFEQANVGAAVDVMMLLNQLNTDTSREGGGLKRAKVGKYGGDDDSLPPMHLLDDDEEEGEEDDVVWMEDDDGEEDADDTVDASNSLDDDDDDEEEEEEEEDDDEEGEEKSRKFLKSKDKKKSPPRRRQFRIEDL